MDGDRNTLKVEKIKRLIFEKIIFLNTYLEKSATQFKGVNIKPVLNNFSN